MKDFAKSIRTTNSHVGNEAIVMKDGNVWVVLYANETKSEEFDTEAEAREFARKVGNSKVGNAYGWREKNGHQELYNPNVPFGGHTRGYVEKSKSGYVGAKTNGSIVISQKEFASEEEAKKYVENSKVGNAGTYAFIRDAHNVISSLYGFVKDDIGLFGITDKVKSKGNSYLEDLNQIAKDLQQEANFAKEMANKTKQLLA